MQAVCYDDSKSRSCARPDREAPYENHPSYAEAGIFALRSPLPVLLFYEKFVSRVSEWKQIRVSWALQTNGLALDEAWCQFLQKHGFLVGLSLDLLPEAHNGACGAGTYDRVTASLGLLRRYGVDVNVLCTLTKAVAEQPEREVNLSEFCDSCKTIVDKRYTFTYYPFTGKTCLFDREADPEERVNLGDRPKYAELERKFLMHAVDFLILSKGIRIEAHDLNPEVAEGIEKKHPSYLDTFDIAFPLGSMTEIRRLKQAGLSHTYNEFCRTRPIKAGYGTYFDNKK